MAGLKADDLLSLMKQHFETDEGKELCKKIGLVYQINIAPKVFMMFLFFIFWEKKNTNCFDREMVSDLF